MLECWVVWSCVDCLDVVQAANAAMSSWMQLQKIQMPVRLLFPCVLSCLTKSWIQPLPYKELVDWLKFSILIALMEGLAPKSSSSGKAGVGICQSSMTIKWLSTCRQTLAAAIHQHPILNSASLWRGLTVSSQSWCPRAKPLTSFYLETSSTCN